MGDAGIKSAIQGSNVFFFFNDTATTEIYTTHNTLSLHDALPISKSIGIAHLEYNYDEVYKMPIDFGKYQTSSMKQFYNDNHMTYGLGAGVTVPIADAISADLGFRLTVVDSRLEMQRVFAPMSPFEAQPPSAWVFTQWSGGIRWRL